MYTSQYAALRGSLPFKYRLNQEVFLPDSENLFTFDVIKDIKEKPVAIVRQYIHEKSAYAQGTFGDSIRALNILQASGVEVAPFIPLRVSADVGPCVVSFIEGPDLDVDQAGVTPKQLLVHAWGLGNYLIRAIDTQPYILSDFIAPKQYKVANGKPVLVDIEGYIDQIDEYPDFLVIHNLNQILGLYGPLLPQAESQQLELHTAELINTV